MRCAVKLYVVCCDGTPCGANVCGRSSALNRLDGLTAAPGWGAVEKVKGRLSPALWGSAYLASGINALLSVRIVQNGFQVRSLAGRCDGWLVAAIRADVAGGSLPA